MRRVAVSGIGVVSPLGNSAADCFANARAGRSGVHRLEVPFASRLNAPLAATATGPSAAINEVTAAGPVAHHPVDSVSTLKASSCAWKKIRGQVSRLIAISALNAG